MKYSRLSHWLTGFLRLYPQYGILEYILLVFSIYLATIEACVCGHWHSICSLGLPTLHWLTLILYPLNIK
ncbi:hypothetical protein BD408DRAFT_420852 [Parasitella parasitica]|nr:hypothetical protein BD408DRAFT_420852 [Parasitella parasitica]